MIISSPASKSARPPRLKAKSTLLPLQDTSRQVAVRPYAPVYQWEKPAETSPKSTLFVTGDKGRFGLSSSRIKLNLGLALVAIAIIILSVGCADRITVSPGSRPTTPRKTLARMGYSIQVGAFANLDNAVRLSETLNRYELDAYYFIHETGLYKVRFGDFPSKESARRKAESIRATGIIEAYYLVSPDDYAVVRQRRYGGRKYLREEIVATAKRFVGVPYRWGGSSPNEGFDCSGLTMVVYQLNGLNLPRSSRAQYGAGTPVKKNKLSRGDLVFFATSRGNRVSHVGIYTGKGRFIHAPGRGKTIRTGLLTNRYFKNKYVGARTYLQ